MDDLFEIAKIVIIVIPLGIAIFMVSYLFWYEVFGKYKQKG